MMEDVVSASACAFPRGCFVTDGNMLRFTIGSKNGEWRTRPLVF